MSTAHFTLDSSNESPASGANARLLLEVHDLRSGYGRIPVLHGVSLRLHKGEALGIVGHNGMGKTTLLKTIVGLLPAVGGRILLDGADVTREPAHVRSRRGLAYVPQGRGILPGLSTLDNLRLAWTGDSHESEQEAVDRCLSMFPRLAPLLDRRGGALSGGEQQILALARALIPNPWIVLLDEPSEGVQPSIVHEIGQLLLRLRKDAGLAILIVEQNLDLVLDVATHIAVLERGQVAREFSPDEMGAGSALVEALGLGSVRMARGAPTVARAAPSLRTPHAAPPQQPIQAAHQAPQAAAQPPAPVSRTNPSNGDTAPIAGAIMSRVKRPTHDQMKEIVSSLHMSMSDREITEYLEVMEGPMQAYDRLQELPDNLPPVRYPRTPGYRPGAAENPLNAWAVKSEVRGAAYGPLAGKRVVLKDNVCLAGVPMMNGASTLEGYVPDVDATVVTRILDAGGIIVGKSHCEYFCLSGGSHTSALGPVHNPYKHGYAAGGSSSGSGALVGAGEVEMAIGGDQGGSIRMPACWSGCYGMMDKYTAALGRGVAGMRIAVVSEGFGHAVSEPDVDQKVRQGAERLRALSASVDEVSIPMHLDGASIWTAIALEGLQMQMMHGNGMGFNWKGMYTTSLLDAHANWRARANELSRTLKISMLVGEYFVRHYRGHYYAKAQNLSRLLRQTYDEVLNRYDLLLMPTLPMKATPLPDQNAPLALYCQRGFEMLPNTCPFDVTGHPAMSIPCGMSQGLPIGLMLIGKHYNESTIYRAAHAFEQLGDWRGF